MSSAHPKSPKDRLLIGEAARLLGTTQKAIRHYEKLGLLDELERSESGYRMYTSSDLLRLYRIRKLRSLGLSLRRIEGILGDSGPSIEFESVVEALLGEVEVQIEHLERRRADLHRMLKESVTDYSEISISVDEPHAFAILRDRLGERWESLDPKMLDQMREFWNTLDAFEWPRGYSEFQENLARYMAEHPGESQRLLALEERLAVLANQPEDSKEIELLAGDYADFFAQSTFLDEVSGQSGLMNDHMEGLEQMLSGVALNAMYPAQKRCMELLIERLSLRDG